MSKPEQILEAIRALLLAVLNAKVERNMVVPEKIQSGGLILVRGGDPGEPETALGCFGSIYYSHDVEIEVYVENGDAVMRDALFDALRQEIGTLLDADPTLGGLAFGMTYGRLEIHGEALVGALAIKAGVFTVITEYETASPLG